MNTITLPYNSNDAHIWTDKDPDLELIEPRILVSINRNYLVYGRKLGRPAQNHPVILVNHGENPVAFKVLTTDNYAYFVNHVFGVIPGRHLHAIPHVRAPNQFNLLVFRRPYDCFCDEQQPSHWNTPRKDKLFILLAPVFSFNIPPAAVFHHEGAYEKLRICLEYTGMPVDPAKDVSLIFKKFPGWCTWKIEKKKEAFDLLGKTREEAKKMITNTPSRKPLVFEEIPEVLPSDVSKKKKITKLEKRKKKEEKARPSDIGTPAGEESPVKPSTELHVGRFAGKLAIGTYQEGGKGGRKSVRMTIQEQLHKATLRTKLSAEASKLLQLSQRDRWDEPIDITPKSFSLSLQQKPDSKREATSDTKTLPRKKDSNTKPKSTMKDLKAILAKKSKEHLVPVRLSSEYKGKKSRRNVKKKNKETPSRETQGTKEAD